MEVQLHKQHLKMMLKCPLHYQHAFASLSKINPGKIQDGNGGRAVDLVSSLPRDPAEKLKTCLAEIKRQGETLETLRSWKASPCHKLIKEQLACQIPAPWVCRAAAPFCQALHPSGCARPQPHTRPTHSGVPSSWTMLDPCTTRITTPQLCQPPASGPTPHWDTYLFLDGTVRSTTTWIPTTCPCWTPTWSRSDNLPGHLPLQTHHPSGPAEPQLHMG
jgi:hypothetical protein